MLVRERCYNDVTVFTQLPLSLVHQVHPYEGNTTKELMGDELSFTKMQRMGKYALKVDEHDFALFVETEVPPKMRSAATDQGRVILKRSRGCGKAAGEW